MCTVITLVLKDKSKVPIYSRVFEARVRNLIISDALSDGLPPYDGILSGGEIVVFPVKNACKPKEFCCDCGTALGALNTRMPERRTPSKKEISKKRKQGWSDTKINRWVKEFERANARDQRKYHDEVVDTERHLEEVERQDPDGWMETFSALLTESGDTYLKLFVYSSPETYDIADALKGPMQRLRLSNTEINRQLWTLEEGLVYEIRQ